jgi:hypothetical protein
MALSGSPSISRIPIPPVATEVVTVHARRVADEEGYLLDNRQAEAGQRFDALSELFNASTFRHLAALGLGLGWRVWEVGAGGPGLPSWLAEQVGPDGQVLATDIDTAWMDDTAGYQVRRHDVGVDPPPQGPFDLNHGSERTPGLDHHARR